MVLEEIFDIGTLEELRRQLDSSAGRRLRKALLREFWKVCRYSNAEEWNRAVRVCGALAIVGWGNCEPVVAYCGGDWTAWGDQNEASGSTFKGWRGSHLGGLDDPAGYPAVLHPSLILLWTSVGWLVALDRTVGERQYPAVAC